MALVLADRVKETTTVTGTGTATLLGAATGYQTFAVIGNANTTYYCIAGQGTSEWEVGIGTYTASGTTLARTTVLSSSNGGSLVNFSAGNKDVFVTYPSGKSVNYEQNGGVVISESGSADALRITNTGTGNSLLVEDSANPDSSPFIINNAGNVGIGVTSSGTKLLAQGTQVVEGAMGVISQFISTTAYNTSPISGLSLGTAYNSGGSVAGMGGIAIGKENSIDGNYSGYLALYTRPNGGSTTERLRINSMGNVGIGNIPSDAYKLEVSGKSAATTQVSTNGITVNSQVMTTSQTIAAGSSGFTVGPFSIASGAVLTLESGSRHVII